MSCVAVPCLRRWGIRAHSDGIAQKVIVETIILIVTMDLLEKSMLNMDFISFLNSREVIVRNLSLKG